MVQNTEFGKAVKKALIDRNETLTWLSREVTEKTGMYADTRYLRKIFIGDRNAPKIKKAICEVLGLPEDVYAAD